MTPEDLASKIEWEGGIFAALEYGLTGDDLDGGSNELREAWLKLCEEWAPISRLAAEVESLLPEAELM